MKNAIFFTVETEEGTCSILGYESEDELLDRLQGLVDECRANELAYEDDDPDFHFYSICATGIDAELRPDPDENATSEAIDAYDFLYDIIGKAILDWSWIGFENIVAKWHRQDACARWGRDDVLENELFYKMTSLDGFDEYSDTIMTIDICDIHERPDDY